MELNELLERFLPEYEQKVRPYEMSKRVLCNAQEFYDKYFPEALENFADKICKKQRENCHTSACEWDFPQLLKKHFKCRTAKK